VFGTPSPASLLINAQSSKVITLQSLSAHFSPPKLSSFRAPPTTDVPVQPDQLGVHRSRRLHPGRPDPNLDLLQKLRVAHRLHSTRPRRSAHPPILSHATAGQSAFPLRLTASTVFAGHGLGPPLLASHLRLQGSSTLLTRVPDNLSHHV